MMRRTVFGFLFFTCLTFAVFSGARAGIIKSIKAYPNPFDPSRGTVTIEWELSKDVQVDYMIYDLSGRRVLRREFRPGSQGGHKGLNSVKWDGKNEHAEIVSPGVYVIAVRVKTTTVVKPVYEIKYAKVGVK